MMLLLLAECVILLSVTLVHSSPMEDKESEMDKYRSFLEGEDLSDEGEDCEVKYEKVGCFKDKRENRALPEKLFSDRKNIEWEAGKWEAFLKRLACRCAKESKEKGYVTFGLQFYGECWSGPSAGDTFDKYGKTDRCLGFQYGKCDDENGQECVGKGRANYVYAVKQGGSGGGSGSPSFVV